MAHIHKATLRPTKIDLLRAWLPTRPWFDADGELQRVGAYRFDDPAGQVGIEASLVRSGDGTVFHVPLTYRDAPLPGAEAFLVGTAEHSVLGQRWVYDGCGDPVAMTAFATAILTGGTQAQEYVDVGGRLEPLPPTVTVAGSGNRPEPSTEIHAVRCHDEGPTTVVRAAGIEVVVARVVGTEISVDETLAGRWDDGESVVLAGLRLV
ncbi:CG0192-related protein [Thermasporomyces composti]|jgi:hypothetical protein|uniref:Maltokinase N-terminal cap domain-containing protein n=1 Tax=Thermasporomyces composti TaxID=696763 RepID=A0A3D9V4Z5_THECX|nr:hypothetical protein [Thermasporomyces composti]REF36882.1 hypothetical protein DFJ64_2317 [Thermasporomyces composti]